MKEIKLKVKTHKGKILAEALSEEGLMTGGTCGGMGTCGKCKATVNGQEVLACKYRITEDVIVQVPIEREDITVKEAGLRLPEGFVFDKVESGTYGIAIDLGTTTVVVMLWDLAQGRLMGVEAISNPQRFYGADVMSRISFVLRSPWNLKRVQSSLINELNQAISRLVTKYGLRLGQIRKIVAVGNTTMSHLFLGEDITGLAAYPFTPAFSGSVETTARQLGIAAHEEAEVYVGPNMAGHVGSDITAGVLASSYSRADGNYLFLDIGTNGEMYLQTEGKSYCCSTAAGPAFEGSGLHQGMRAADGAVYKVKLVENKVKCETVGGATAKGICGSGIIDALAVMLEAGAMDRFGGIASDFVLTEESEELPAVVVTQRDIREVQMAKAAVSAGCKMLLAESGLELEELTEIGIAGAFGNGICIESGIAIGLLPKADVGRFQSLGNAAGLGASMMLLSEDCRKRGETIAASVSHVELAALPVFQELYIEEMNF